MRGQRGQWLRWLIVWIACLSMCVWAQAQSIVDLAMLDPEIDGLLRVYGSAGRGNFGVPVTGGFDCDGDGFQDTAMSSMIASPLERERAGEVYLIFGDGTVSGTRDSAGMSPDILKIFGAAPHEITGSEIWMDDVTGDGLGDLLIGRQNYSPTSDRIGAGALTLIVGGSALRDYAATLQPLDLQSPPAMLTIVTFVGPEPFGRLGMWMRTGDMSGDIATDTDGNEIPAPIADIVVAADQVAVNPGQAHNGQVYLIRGGAHLAMSQTIDLANFGTTPLAGHIIRIDPPEQADHYHFGATCQIADLNGNGVGEVIVAATLNRASASLRADGISDGRTAHSFGGSARGTLYIAWDDNFRSPDAWQPGASFRITSPLVSHSIIRGGVLNHHFGEEILGGLDYNNDGLSDLFVGDIDGDLSDSQTRLSSGAGHVLYHAAQLQGLIFTLDAPPDGIIVSTFLGAARKDIAADTAAHGDFDSDVVLLISPLARHTAIPWNVVMRGFFMSSTAKMASGHRVSICVSRYRRACARPISMARKAIVHQTAVMYWAIAPMPATSMAMAKRT
ncbi:MAG: hypothetical protein ETSY2_41395 [Candidatus Entotheonella gemina]|uniref:ASPIC/UnbV domain-containing protein n=1 Tax=Candidatus Entotheonella gemina TaxID=1429439 RepID=W4LMF9_9BACT|nr:MAG: hypothetical protein ETSY2_41395 [Candidatus Entotheonella gemina]